MSPALPTELKGSQVKALFFDGTQWLPLSAEKMNKRGFGYEVSFAAGMSEKLGRTIGGVIMVQGSGDSKHQKKAEAYAANLQAWIQTARKDLQTPNLLFVCSRLRAGQPKEMFPFAHLVRLAQESGSEFVDCDALEVGDDEVHFTAKGQIDLGRLFADKLHAMMSEAEVQR
jgi:hypothetical protein